jgi:hypothetical protein
MLTYRHTTAVNYDAEDDKTDHGDHLDNREDELGFAVTFFFSKLEGRLPTRSKVGTSHVPFTPKRLITVIATKKIVTHTVGSMPRDPSQNDIVIEAAMISSGKLTSQSNA